jgi:hypothetical protein
MEDELILEEMPEEFEDIEEDEYLENDLEVEDDEEYGSLFDSRIEEKEEEDED